MRTGKGGFYLLAAAVFSVCLGSAPVKVQAADNKGSQIYVTPGTESSAKPLFLQRLFGSAGSNAGLGAGKPYDFSKPNAVRHGNEQSYEDFQAGLAAQMKAQWEEDSAKQKKAIDTMYAQEAKRQQQEAQKRLQEIASIQRPVFPPNMPHVGKAANPQTPMDRKARREARRAGQAIGRSNSNASANAARVDRPMIYNKAKAEKNSHPPIFLQQ